MQVFLAEITSAQHATLGAEETRHCMKVLRHQIGDQIYCTDGGGAMYQATILGATKSSTQLEIGRRFPAYGEHPFEIILGVSPLRLKDRFEWVVEKAVELGATQIYPLQCERTDMYKAKFKPERIRNLMLTALKQCLRSQLPILHPMMPFDQVMEQELPASTRLIGYCEAQTPIQTFEAAIKQHNTHYILIGPEGDFTPSEVEIAIAKGFDPISLGENRLRTETAAIHALSLVKYLKSY